MSSRIMLLLLLFLLCLPVGAVRAEVEGRTVRAIDLPEAARQVVISPGGRSYFVLGAEKLYLYSIDGRQIGSVEIGSDVAGITPQSDGLVLLYRKGKQRVEYLSLDVIQQIDTTDSPVRGNLDAPVTIIVFDDFQCPYCARLAPTLKKVQANNPQNVRMVLKNFPLSMHRYARAAAIAAEAAGRQGKFWEMHDQLFANYNQLNEQKIDDLARQIGLDMKRFNKDRKDAAIQAAISRDQEQGSALGVRGTPTVFINGRLLRDRSERGFQQMIEQELARLKKSP
ncbi:disulfide bond formation protein DsbA [Geothermobacter hydrogeniphilus]|uniref:Disulfide bond formation protein DsbA n=1 Tax=Geothermobacter hydrogeniphilus TaxID=1969733 RepID=A0A2K2H9Z3_9BACT|nr:thioredoxin domain-containing protein [Geothermobacter hydrogeniphilus]PNU20138.1 disulfide bond formation protein DsbA [Geothermobacter hydrogeniphilus]